MKIAHKIAPCLWFDNHAAEAASLYTSIFPNSRIIKTTHFTEAGFEIHGRPAGSVMTVEFEIAGQTFTALNGGPLFRFSEAISFQVYCEDQAEIDHFWTRLTADGGSPSQCGWLKDKFGLSWQIVPARMGDWFSDSDPVRSNRVMQAMLQMGKLDIPALERAYAGS